MVGLIFFVVFLVNFNCGVGRGRGRSHHRHDDERNIRMEFPRDPPFLEPEHFEGARHSGKNTETNEDLSVEIQRIYNNGNKAPPLPYEKDSPITFDRGDTIELTCIQKDQGLIWWTDTYKFETAKIYGKSLKLQITPDADDINLNLTCKTSTVHHGERNITATLTFGNNTSGLVSKPNEIYIKPGKDWTSNTSCYGIIQQPIIAPTIKPTVYYTQTIKSNLANHNVIHDFNKNQNGTIFFGIQYKLVTNNALSGSVIVPKVSTYERVKSKYIFYLDEEAKTSTQHEKLTIQTEKNSDSSSGSTAIVAGVLGTIVLVLVGLLIAIWYKYLRQPADDDAGRVIYTEIEERPAAPPPPPRNPIPYAKIVGTLVPSQHGHAKEDPYSVKRQSQQTENMYCIVK